MNKFFKNDNVQKAIGSSVMIAIAVLALVITYNWLDVKPKDEKSADISPEIDTSVFYEKADSRSELDSLKEMQSISIYENGLVTPPSLITSCLDNSKKDNCNNEIASISKKITTIGNIQTAKLYIKAGVSRNNGPIGPLTKYDSLWILFDNGEYSGHLIRSKAMYNGISEDGYSELMFDLENLPLTKKLPYNENNPSFNKNVLNQLTIPNTHLISSFVSTLGYGRIDKLIIYFTGGQLLLSP